MAGGEIARAVFYKIVGHQATGDARSEKDVILETQADAMAQIEEKKRREEGGNGDTMVW
jgi:hypothetical protein